MRKRTYSSTKGAGTAAEKLTMGDDLALMLPQLQATLGGFLEAKRGYENGTDEVRRLLLQECNLIYECNICRNMFRSLASFIRHKRSYCATMSGGTNTYTRYADQQSAHPAQPTGETGSDEQLLAKAHESPKEAKRTRKNSNSLEHGRDVSEGNSLSVNNNDNSITTLKQELPDADAAEADSKQCIIQLESMPNSSKAVYQTLKRHQNDDIKREVDEVQLLLGKCKNTIVGPDGKAASPRKLKLSQEHKQEIEQMFKETTANCGKADAEFKCDKCAAQFQTEKTLQLHIQKLHNSATSVYQCPACTQTFLQPAAVIRHLANEHKKPVRRIRMMRETILKRRRQAGDMLAAGSKPKSKRELKRLIINDEDRKAAADAAAQNGKDESEPVLQKKVMSKCIYCGRFFERRAALSTHLMKCKVKLDAMAAKAVAIKRQVAQDYKKQQRILGNSQQDADKAEDSDENLNEMFDNLQKNNFGEGLKTLDIQQLNDDDEEESETEVEAEQKPAADKLNNIAENGQQEPKDIKSNATAKAQKSQLNELDNSIAESELPSSSSANLGKDLDSSISSSGSNTSKYVACRCKICNKHFNALSNVRRHISMFHYRSRKFGCKLCDYRAFRRYDIINHLGFVHKMQIDRNSMSDEYVSVHDVKYSKEDMDGDIVLLSADAQKSMTQADDNNQDSTGDAGEKVQSDEDIFLKQSTVTKRGGWKRRRGVAALLANAGERAHLPKSQKHKLRNNSASLALHKRPIRNRTKPVNNDFVYDLSELSKGAASSAAANIDEATVLLPLLQSTNCKLVEGATARIALECVQKCWAAASSPPVLPAERPQMRARLISSNRSADSSTSTAAIIDSNDLEEARRKTTQLLDDSFLDKLSKQSSTSFRIKPCLAFQHDTLTSLLKKVDSSIQKHLSSNNASTASATNCKQTNIVNELLNSNSSVVVGNSESSNFSLPMTPHHSFTSSSSSSPLPAALCASISSTTSVDSPTLGLSSDVAAFATNISPPTTPNKRISMLQRLVENRNKQGKDCYLRAALEN